MRDAFGGAFSIKLMLIFLILYVSFICVALNYARAFRVKNRIINIIEQHEGYKGDAPDKIVSYLNSTGYSVQKQLADGSALGINAICEGCTFYEPGYSVMRVKSGKKEYYRVETYIIFTLPIVQANFPIAVRGETRVIELP